MSDSLNFLFVRVTKLHFARAQAFFARLGLSRGQPPVLFSLWKEDGLTQRELSERLSITPATMTTVLQRMERDGWISRGPDPQDLRVTRTYLTPKGKDIQAEVEMTLGALEAQCFSGFTPQEKELMRQFLHRIKENLETEEWRRSHG